MPLRILIVDDNDVFREEFGSLLKDDGHEVDIAASAPKALEHLETQEYDVVFTDLKMPRQSGMELLKETRSRWPRTLVVMITGYATIETALEAMKLGAFDYIRKPFKVDQIQETLKLVAQERELGAPSSWMRDPEAEARRLAGEGTHEVLYFATVEPVQSRHLHFEPLDPEHPSSLNQRTEAFLLEHPRTAVVVSSIELLLENHRVGDIVSVLERLREKLAGHGPLRVSFDPTKVSTSVALAITGAVADKELRDTMEALSNPIRRRILQRLSEAAASFSEIMKSTGLDDSPKMSFHIRRLVDDGLIMHERDTYRLTGRGTAAITLLKEASFIPPSGKDANFAFPSIPPQ